MTNSNGTHESQYQKGAYLHLEKLEKFGQNHVLVVGSGTQQER
jgi:hypothetical protein